MNISDWPISRIMQLPDHLFGRRYLISCQSQVLAQSTVWNISELAFPEYCVIWEAQILTWEIENTRTVFRIALGDQLPTAAAIMGRLEPVFPGLGYDGIEPRFIHCREWLGFQIRKLKFPIHATGRRLVCEFANTYTVQTVMGVILTVSSIPKDIPSWFGSD